MTKCLDFTFFLTGFAGKSCFPNLMSAPLAGPDLSHIRLHERTERQSIQHCMKETSAQEKTSAYMETGSSIHTESTSTCWRARYLSLRSFWNAYQRSNVRKIYRPQCCKEEINGKPNVQDLTHSSITSPSPTTRGPASSGGFLRASSSASASASCLLSFSSVFEGNKTEFPRRFRRPVFGLYIFLLNTGREHIRDVSVLLTGLGHSGSRKTTRKICSTATWSFCSSNCIEMYKHSLVSICVDQCHCFVIEHNIGSILPGIQTKNKPTHWDNKIRSPVLHVS